MTRIKKGGNSPLLDRNNLGEITMKQLAFKTGLSLILPFSILILWGYMADIVNNPMILPTSQEVLKQFIMPSKSIIGLGSLFTNIAVSLIRVLLGYTVALLVALPLGILMGSRENIYYFFNTFLGFYRPVPPIAWVPLILAWLGMTSFATIFGLRQGTWYVYLSNFKLSMVYIIFLGAFFPIITSAIHAVKNVPKTLIESARVLGATKSDIFRKILLPRAAPTLMNGMRTGLGAAWGCLVSAEMLPGSLSGVGYLITHAYELARVDIVITGMICIGVIGALLDYAFRYLEEKKFSWQHTAR